MLLFALAQAALAGPQALLVPNTPMPSMPDGKPSITSPAEPLPVKLIREYNGGWFVKTVTQQPTCHPVAHPNIAFGAWVSNDSLSLLLLEETVVTWRGGSAHLMPGQALTQSDDGSYIAQSNGLSVTLELPTTAVGTQLEQAQPLPNTPAQALHVDGRHSVEHKKHTVVLDSGAPIASAEPELTAHRACLTVTSKSALPRPPVTYAQGELPAPTTTTTLPHQTALDWRQRATAGRVVESLEVDPTTAEPGLDPATGCVPLIANLGAFPHHVCSPDIKAEPRPATPGILHHPSPAWPHDASPLWPSPYACEVSLTVAADGTLTNISPEACEEPFLTSARVAFEALGTLEGRRPSPDAEPEAWTDRTTLVFVRGREVWEEEIMETLTNYASPPAAQASSATEPLKFHHSEIASKRRVTPKYPESEKGKHDERIACKYRIIIEETGVPSSVEVVDPPETCPQAFADSGAEALMKWRFYPAKANGETVRAQFVVRITFMPS